MYELYFKIRINIHNQKSLKRVLQAALVSGCSCFDTPEIISCTNPYFLHPYREPKWICVSLGKYVLQAEPFSAAIRDY